MISGAAVTSDPIAVDYTITPEVTAPVVESASVDVTPTAVVICNNCCNTNTYFPLCKEYRNCITIIYNCTV